MSDRSTTYAALISIAGSILVVVGLALKFGLWVALVLFGLYLAIGGGLLMEKGKK